MKIKYSIIASAILLTNGLQAKQDVELKSGWNLIGIQEKPFAKDGWIPADFKNKYPEIELIIGANGRYGEGGRADTLSAMKAGEGFWIKVANDINMTFDGDSNFDTVSLLNAGWNLVAFKKQLALDSQSFSSFKQDLASKGYYINLIIGANGRYGEGGRADTLSKIDPNAGYWVKVSKEIAKKYDSSTGLQVQVFANYETTVNPTIAISSNGSVNVVGLDGVSGDVVVSQVSTTTGKIKELKTKPIDGSSVSFTNGSGNGSDYDLSTETAGSIGVYVYGIGAGGSPVILANATLYEKESDGNYSKIGTSNSLGFIESDKIQKGGEYKLTAEGYNDYLFKIDENYDRSVFNAVISKESSIIIGEDDEPDDTDTSNGRVLNSILYASSDKKFSSYDSSSDIKLFGKIEELSLEADVNPSPSYQFGVNIPYRDDLMSIFENDPTFKSTIILGVESIKMTKASSGSLYAKGYENDEKLNFTTLFKDASDGNGNSDIGYLTVRMPKDYEINGKLIGDIYDELDEDNGTNYNLKLAIHNGGWSSTNVITVKTNSKKEDGKPYLKKLSNGKVLLKLPDSFVGTESGATMEGFHPFALIYQEKAAFTVPVQIKVLDKTNDNPIKTATVSFAGQNYPVNENGEVNVSVSKNAESTLLLATAFEPNYVSAKGSLDLSQSPNGGIIAIKLDKIPDSATIKGQVIDKDEKWGISATEVRIIKPISLDRVEQKIDRDGRRYIEVGLDPSATYTWYIKESDSSVTTTGDRTLNRVSSEAWVKTKEGVGKDGNKLYLDEVLKQLFKGLKDGESESDTFHPNTNVLGTFEIAIKVDHDVDNDGSADYREYAVGNEYDELDGGANALDPTDDNLTQNYGVNIGVLKVSIDQKKLAKHSGEAAGSEYVTYFVGDTGVVHNANAGTNEDPGNINITNPDNSSDPIDTIDEFDAAFISNALKLTGSNKLRAFSVEAGSSTTVEDIEWKIVIRANIKDADGDTHTVYIKPEQNQNGKVSYKWTKTEITCDGNTYTNIDDVQGEGDEGEFIGKKGEFAKILNETMPIKTIGKLNEGVRKVKYKHLLNAISNNDMLPKLRDSIGDIAEEAGIESKNYSDADYENKLIIVDGLTLTLVAEVKLKDQWGRNYTAVTYSEGVGLQAKDGVKDLLNVSDVAVSPVSQVAAEEVVKAEGSDSQGYESDTADRAGYFSFPRVPYYFGKLDNSNSFLRIQAKRYDYFPSKVQTIPTFTKQEGAYTIVELQPIEIKRRGVKDVTLSIVDKDDNLLSDVNGTLVVTGLQKFRGERAQFEIKNGQILSDSGTLLNRRSTKIFGRTTQSLGTLQNILKGKQQIELRLDGFLPVVKSVNITDSTSSISLNVKKLSSISDFAPKVFIDFDRTSLDPATGKLIIRGRVTEKDTGETTNTKFTFTVNDEPMGATYNIKTDNTFEVKMKLKPGESKVMLNAINDRGTTIVGPLYFEYNPNYGAMTGTVTGADHTDVVYVDLFDENMNLVATTVADASSGNFDLVNVPVGEYAIQAVDYDVAGNVYYSQTAKVKIKAGTKPSITLKVNKEQTVHTGAPSLSFVYDSLAINDSNVTIAATISNFDFDTDVKDRFVVVINDMPYAVTASDFTKTGDGAFTFTKDYSFNYFNPGTNVVYLGAMNKNGEYILTEDYYFKIEKEVNAKKLNLEFLDKDTNISIPYVYTEVFTTDFDYVGSYLSDYNGSLSNVEIDLESGKKYLLYTWDQDGDYEGNSLLAKEDNGVFKLYPINPATNVVGPVAFGREVNDANYTDVFMKNWANYSWDEIATLPGLDDNTTNYNTDYILATTNAKVYFKDDANETVVVDVNLSGYDLRAYDNGHEDGEPYYILGIVDTTTWEPTDHNGTLLSDGETVRFEISSSKLLNFPEVDWLIKWSPSDEFSMWEHKVYNPLLDDIMNQIQVSQESDRYENLSSGPSGSSSEDGNDRLIYPPEVPML